MGKSKQRGENYISLQAKVKAKATGKNPCDILIEWLSQAKQLGDKLRAREIQKAQKFLSCRNKQKRRKR